MGFILSIIAELSTFYETHKKQKICILISRYAATIKLGVLIAKRQRVVQKRLND